jgi:patatin-related protein
MHGVTRELHSLVRASAALDAEAALYAEAGLDAKANLELNPFEHDQTEYTYWWALRELWREQGIRTSVVVDIISGTSAGGINGVVLAKAIARNQSQQTLRDIWLDKADFNQLLRLPSLLPPLVRRLHIGRRRPLLGLRIAASSIWMRPPLAGDRMSRWLYEALGQMGDEPLGRWGKAQLSSLVPRDGSLDLYVTATDLAGFRRFLSVQGTQIQDRTHRRVFRFRQDGSADDFSGEEATTALAFAARVTACFPGAFPPVNFTGFHRDVGAPDTPAQIAARFFPSRPEESTNDTYLIDGGVLDNFPFDHAIRAITRKTAFRQVKRLLLYIEPDPHPMALPEAGGATGRAGTAAAVSPSWLGTIWHALSTIPAHEPVLDALFDLDAFNRQVELVARITNENYETVKVLIDPLLLEADEQLRSQEPSFAGRGTLTERIRARVAQQFGPAYRSYVLLRLREAGDYLASLIAEALAYPPESSQAGFVQEVMQAWFAAVPAADHTSLLDRVDRPYRERQLRFAIDGVSRRYQHHEAERPLLDVMMKELSGWLTELWDATSPQALSQQLSGLPADLFPPVSAITSGERLPSPAAFAKDHAAELHALVEFLGAVLSQRFAHHAGAVWYRFTGISMPEDFQRDLIRRYVGFPLWDAMLFPVLALTGVSQFSPIEVARISPEEAQRIPPSKRGPLRGNALHHFGAFEARADREHDYLCGRLDGVERLLTLLQPPNLDECCRAGFANVWWAEGDLLFRHHTLWPWSRPRPTWRGLEECSWRTSRAGRRSIGR